MCIRSCFILFGLIIASVVATEIEHQNYDWDVLIFTQHWPVTVCYEWQSKNTDNKCVLPPLKDIWTVHGIWPTKLGQIGPEFCNASWKFDPTQLYSIEKQLEIYWLNIEKNTPLFSFWKHEWQKHGTCATLLPDLDSESKYFSKGIKWIDQYEMNTILAKAGIVAQTDTGYTVHHIYDGITNVIKKRPILQCATIKHSHLSYISEIRLCFNKQLTLIDCDGVKGNDFQDNERYLTNCNMNKTIMYLNAVPMPPPNLTLANPAKKPMNLALEIYRFVNFLKWLTS